MPSWQADLYGDEDNSSLETYGGPLNLDIVDGYYGRSLGVLKSVRLSPTTDLYGNSIQLNELRATVLSHTLRTRYGRLHHRNCDIRLVGSDGTTYGTYVLLQATVVHDDLVEIVASHAITRALDDEETHFPSTIWSNNPSEEGIVYAVYEDCNYLFTGGSSSETVGDVLEAMLYKERVASGDNIDIDETLYSQRLRGYIEGTATKREVLQMICMAYGAYVSDSDGETLIRVAKPTADYVLVPDDEVFMRPKVRYEEPASKITIHYYDYEPIPSGGIERGDKYVVCYEVDGVPVWNGGEWEYKYYYLQRAGFLTEVNPDSSSLGEGSGEVVVEGNTLIGSHNVQAVMAWLKTLYFRSMTMTFDCLNEGKYRLGQRLVVPTGLNGKYLDGYVASIDYKFGCRTRSTIKIVGCSVINGATLTVNFVTHEEDPQDRVLVCTRAYLFPDGYEYSLGSGTFDVAGDDGILVYEFHDTESHIAIDGTTLELFAIPMIRIDLAGHKVFISRTDETPVTDDNSPNATIRL